MSDFTRGKKMQKENNLIIVDLMTLAHRYKHRKQITFASDTLKTIMSIAKSYSAKDVIVISDYGKSAYRLSLFPEYKADRAARYADQTPEEAKYTELFFAELANTRNLLTECSNFIQLKGVEADDIATYIVSLVKDKYDNIWLVSTDSDWDQNLDKNVHRFSTRTRKEYTLDNFYEEHDVDTPNEWTILKAIQGGHDNIKGVEDIGPKRGYALIRGMDSIFELVDKLPIAGKQKFIQRLNDSEDKLVLNDSLVNLREYCATAIAFPDSENIKKIHEFLDNLKESYVVDTEVNEEDINDL